MNPAVGDKLTLSISDIAFGGEGVARTAGPPASEPRGAGRARCPQRAADKPETLDTSTMDDSPDLSSPPRRAVPSAPYLRSTAANPGVPPPAFVIFVPFVAVGEEVEAEITEVKKNFARAKLL